MRLLLPIALAHLLLSPTLAAAEVRFYAGPLQSCAVKGIIKSQAFEVPQPSFLGTDFTVPRFIGVAAIADLKRQAAALGANRIVVRNVPSEGSRSFGTRTGAGAEWTGSVIVAEAYRC